MGGDSSNNTGEWCAVCEINAMSVVCVCMCVCVYVCVCVCVIVTNVTEGVVGNTLTNISNYHTHAQISSHQFNMVSLYTLL